MRLLAISDLHLSHPANRAALTDITDHGDDWLIIAGDIAERLDHQEWAYRELGRRFGKLIWVPGNHDLWTVARKEEAPARGVARYRLLVELARAHGVVTPEDPFLEWPLVDSLDGHRHVLAPLFLLYDYSFRPATVPRDGVREWAREQGAECSDEVLLHADPYPSREAWCAARCQEAARRLAAIPADRKTILINHWPLRADLIHIPRIPRFSPWCGTTLTDDWHRRFRAAVVVSGHLHTRRTNMIDGSRFEEVSLGYPRQWNGALGIDHYIREILPGRPMFER
jgi:predicted phosphodiesterase